MPIEDGYRFKDGEAVQVELSYFIGSGIVSSTNNTLTYQLPNGLTLTKEADGKVYRGTEVVGSYTISKSGEVKMTFTNQEILKGMPFTGDFTFEADVDYSQAGEDGKVIFNDKFNLTIKKPDGDIAVSKGLDDNKYVSGGFNYWDKEGNYYLRWYVKASTKKGTGDKTVRIGDQLNGDSSGSFSGSGIQVLGSYVENSVKVFKLEAEQNAPGTLVSSNEYKLKVSNENELNRSILVENLPALEPGESYILCYTTKVTPDEMNKCKDNDGKMYNKGLAGIKDAPDVKDAQYVSFWRRLSKDGKLKEDGTIEWTITLKAAANGYGEFLWGYTVQDVIPEGLKVLGDVTVKADGKNFDTITAQKLKDGYTIPEKSTAISYEFTFRTNSPTTNGAVTNTATATKDSDTFTAEKELVFGKGDWGISKKHVSTNSDGVASWNIVVTNDLGGTNFTLVDVMDARGANNNRLNDGADGARHWFYKSDLETAVQKSLKLTLRDGSTKQYADVQGKLTIEAFSDYGATNTNKVTDDTTRARAFKITVKDLPVRRMELTVTTREDRNDVKVGETRKYMNAARVEGTSTSAQDTYTRFDSFEKKVSTDNGSTYNQGSTVAYKDVKDKRLCYRVALTTDASQKDDIVIVDTLPPNTVYKESQTKILVDGEEADKNNWSAECIDGTLTLRLSNYNTDGQSHTVQFLYKVDISEDPRWSDLSVSQISYKNTAKWGKEESSTATTVTRDFTEVKKTGEQVMENGKPTNRIRYTVYINPSKQMLNNGNPLTLEDKLELKAGADAYGDLSTVKFYSYEFSGGQPTIGAELPEGVCQILPSTQKYWLRVSVPDKTAIVMQYECEIDPGTAVTPELSNSVYLNDTKKDGINTEVHHNSSGATVKMGQLLLNKMDSYTGMPLKGAKFSIEYYDKTTRSWTLWDNGSTGESGKISTGESGKITLGVTTTGKYNTLKTDTLYRLVEMEAPANYKLDQTPHYVLFAQETEDHETAYRAATGTANNLIVDGVTVEKNSIVFGSDVKTTTMEIRNTYQELTVVKSWLDKDTGKSVEAPVTEVKVQLYSMNKDGSGKTAVGEEVSLNQKNSWSYTWPSEDTPATDKAGNPYYYMVEETTTGCWTLKTSNNNGIQTGKIYLQNYVYSSYVLPSTGGMGTMPFAAVGGMLTVGAALLLAKRKKHEEKGE